MNHPERKAVSDERERLQKRLLGAHEFFGLPTSTDLRMTSGEHNFYADVVRDMLRADAGKDETIRRLREALQTIADFDPRTDTEEGFNEWGEAVLFIRSQEIAEAALAATASPAPDTKDGGISRG